MLTDKIESIIAIVDDDKTFRFIFSVQLLEINNSNKILQFEDGYNILEFLLENKENSDLLPDIIFLDLAMKQIDGWVFIEEFENVKKYLPKDIIIHILTGSNEELDKLKASVNPHISHYLNKPVTNNQLKELIYA
ncbi:MAG: response regulator [Opitutaceae bacterium]|nr:response regulator [Cytophagales bacterium]